MNQSCLLALLLSVCAISFAQTVTLPYNPDANQDSVIGAPDLLEFLPYFGEGFTPGEVLIDGENLTEYIAFLEAAAANATSDTITIPMMPGTNPGQMLYWNGAQWSLVPVGDSGDALILSGETPTWKSLKLGCMDDSFLEFDPEATIDDGTCDIVAVPGCTTPGSCNYDFDANQNDGSCIPEPTWYYDSDGDGMGDTEAFDVAEILDVWSPKYTCEDQSLWGYVTVPGDSCYDELALNFDDPANGPCEYEQLDCQPVEYHGYAYQTVQAGGKCWFAENLRTEQYRDGTPIFAPSDVDQWLSVAGPMVTYYGDGQSDCNFPDGLGLTCGDEEEIVEAFGRLYNGWAAFTTAHGGVCPTGWISGLKSDWVSVLASAQALSPDGNTYPMGSGEWWSWSSGMPLGELDDLLGFGVVPAGIRDAGGSSWFAGSVARFWDGSGGFQLNGSGTAYIFDSGAESWSLEEGRSIRCVQSVLGCMELDACNYDGYATESDGSCIFQDICGVCGGDNSTCGGCVDPAGCNYDPQAGVDDGTCTFPDVGYDCDGNCLPAWQDTLGNCLLDSVECDGGIFNGPIATGPLSEGDILTFEFSAFGELSGLDYQMMWSGFGDSWPSDLSLQLVSPDGVLLLIKGINSPLVGDDHAGIEGLPSSWNTGTPGDYAFSAPGYGLSGSGTWQLQVGCGYGTDVPFEFTLDLQGLCVASGFLGCTDPNYVEYDEMAAADDGSCDTPAIYGCMDSDYFEYTSDANVDDGSCVTLMVSGCTDPNYLEYYVLANIDDGSCSTLVIFGCTDPGYTEYSAEANTDDGSCMTPVVYGCMDSDYLEYNVEANTDDGSCATTLGCTNPDYIEYDVTVDVDDGSCATLVGCADSDVVIMDGYSYVLTTIGNQCWFAENLRTTAYADGTVIPSGLTDGEWMSTTAGAAAVYGEGSMECDTLNAVIDACDESVSLAEYGRLYNWYAVNDTRGLCPTGWHVPTDGEWTVLEDFVTSQGFDGTEGNALKSTSGWPGDGTIGIGTDDFGFAGLPGGYRFFFIGAFDGSGYGGFWWSSSSNGEESWIRALFSTNQGVERNDSNPLNGMSVRCLRNAE